MSEKNTEDLGDLGDFDGSGDLGDFSFSDDDLYQDFLKREGENGTDHSEDDTKEDILLGNQSSGSDKDDLSSLEEVVSHNKSSKASGDIQNLMSMVKKDRDYDISDDAADEDMLEAFRRQKETNKHISSSLSDLPTDLYLLDDPVEPPVESMEGKAGDEKFFTAAKFATIGMSVLAVIIAVSSIYINTRPHEEVQAQSSETTQGTGDIINNAISDDDVATVTQTQGADSDMEDSSNSYSSDENSEDIKYEILSEGGIKTASISYINASGSKESETGVSLPWKKTVSDASSITPHVAAAPGERGTLTCKIYRGNKKIAEDTAAGENASVECKA